MTDDNNIPDPIARRQAVADAMRERTQQLLAVGAQVDRNGRRRLAVVPDVGGPGDAEGGARGADPGVPELLLAIDQAERAGDHQLASTLKSEQLRMLDEANRSGRPVNYAGWSTPQPPPAA